MFDSAVGDVTEGLEVLVEALVEALVELVDALVEVSLVVELDVSSSFTQHWTLSSPGHGQSG